MAKAGGKESCLDVDGMYRGSSAKLQAMSSYQDDYHYYVLGLKEMVSSFSCCEGLTLEYLRRESKKLSVIKDVI